jgi:hypothetical protein
VLALFGRLDRRQRGNRETAVDREVLAVTELEIVAG